MTDEPTTATGRALAAEPDTDAGLVRCILAIEREAARPILEALRAEIAALTPLQYPPVPGAAVRAWVDRATVLALVERKLAR